MPLQDTLTGAFQETQQQQISGKRRLNINSRARTSPTEPPQSLSDIADDLILFKQHCNRHFMIQ